MDDEKLIELVQNNPVLYDQTSPKYMDTNLKNSIWKQIGKQMGISGASCKNRWSNIRDNYRKSLRKTTTVCGQAVKKYKYSEQLSFLKKIFRERETKVRLSEDERSQDPTDEDDDSMLHGYYQIPQELATVVINPAEPTQSRCSSPEAKDFDCPSQSKKIKRDHMNSTPPHLNSDSYSEYFKKKESSSPHEVDAFLSGIAPSLKKLPPHYWHFAKSDIFAAVQKFEYKMMMEQSPFPEGASQNLDPSSSAQAPPTV